MHASSATATAASGEDDVAEPPRTLGKYELLGLIARGGMGEIHLARLPGELGFEKRMVIKTIRSELAADPRFVELFAAEAKTAVALSHPNIAPIYELGRAADGTLFAAMGWVDGPSLASLIDRLRGLGRRLELGAALFIARELLDGLAHAHRRDRDRPPVVHRDVTPRNVLVDRGGRVQIIDFGIAKPAQAEAAGRMGSVGYMAPEQARGEPVDPRADVFGVGCVLFELLTNARAFAGEGVWMLPSLAAVPEPVRPLLERSLALDPGERFADAEAFLRALAPVLTEQAPSWASFGARDLAALLAELFDGEQTGAAPELGGEQTPATRITGELETFATRAIPGAAIAAVESPTAAPSPAPVEARSPRSLAWPLVAILATIAGLGGYALARTDDGAAARPDVTRSEPAVPEPPAIELGSDPPAREQGPDAPASEPAPDPAPALSSDPAPAPPLTLELEPADARVFVDGSPLAGPPYRLARAPEREVELRVEHPDFRSSTVKLGPDAFAEGRLRVELEPLALGALTVLAPAVAWAEVWLDGAKIGTTPLTAKPVREGKHRLEVRCAAAVCGSAQVLLDRSVRVRPGRTLELVAE